MGVVNITPNSFSDGGQFNSSPKDYLRPLLDAHAQILDFGAESTAPFNKSIDGKEELARFKDLLNLLQDEVLPNHLKISIDSYRPEVVTELVKEIRNIQKYKETVIIWNDVSGIVDTKTIEVLDTYKDLLYVLSHNLAPTREQVGNHIKYIDNDLSVDKIKNYFIERLDFLKGHEDRVFIDLCFGFSKSQEQNYEILNNYDEFVDLHSKHLIGLSKKSFLQGMCLSQAKGEKLLESEFYHHMYLSKILLCFKEDSKVVIRTHDINTVERVKRFLFNQKGK